MNYRWGDKNKERDDREVEGLYHTLQNLAVDPNTTTQFYRESNAETPERALLIAVMQNGVEYIKAWRDSNPRKITENVNWVISNSCRGMFCFLPLCEALGTDPIMIRDKLEHTYPEAWEIARVVRRLKLRSDKDYTVTASKAGVTVELVIQVAEQIYSRSTVAANLLHYLRGEYKSRREGVEPKEDGFVEGGPRCGAERLACESRSVGKGPTGTKLADVGETTDPDEADQWLAEHGSFPSADSEPRSNPAETQENTEGSEPWLNRSLNTYDEP